jgi:anhydro-N-acetylmuramic acid kinase
MAYYIGIMSGTSLDGVDVALVDIKGNNDFAVIAAITIPFPPSLHILLQRLIVKQHCDLKEFGALDVALGQFFAHAVNELLSRHEISHNDIDAIGSHGHTVYHAPEDELPFSLQIGNPSFIAELTGITTVADFRQRDIAAAGQGAPLVPAFHQALFSTPKQTRLILNIGGIANATLLQPKQTVIGFDTGPGNGLMDAWIAQHLGQAYDQGGEWAESGQSNPTLLQKMLADPYFSKAIPKSTGREYFNLAWLQAQLDQFAQPIDIVDIQATLLSLTVTSIADAIKQYASNTQGLYVCGGGVHNKQLMQLLGKALPEVTVCSTAELAIDPDSVEATAFAWLAYRTVHQKSGNLPSVTGANRAVILGGIYSA